MSKQYFSYTKEEIEYLKSKDKILGEAITIIGDIKREVNPDLFSSLINSIISQQISAKAANTVRNRFDDKFSPINLKKILETKEGEIQSLGMSMRKELYIKNIANQVHSKSLNLESLEKMSDEEVIKRLVQINGIGIWTAEMLMIFSMQRKNILSFGDLAILNGMKKLYHHKEITKKLFEKYKKRYSPYCSIASLYLWAIAGGALEIK